MEYSFISFQQNWRIESDTWYQLGQCQALIQAISATPLTPGDRERLYAACLLQGAPTITGSDRKTLLSGAFQPISDGNKIPAGKEYPESEARNVLAAHNEIRSAMISEKKVQSLSPELICEFNSKIGREPGGDFEGQPGKIRTRNISTGNKYPAPDYRKVQSYLEQLCDWLNSFFISGQGRSFATVVIQTIVARVYIAWIRPFNDGNSRTARLLEFYLLLRGDLPAIAAQTLSSFYYETRAEYNQQLTGCSQKGGDLTAFIVYAVQGFQSGLEGNLKLILQNQQKITWQNFVRETFQSQSELGVGVVARRRMQLVLTLRSDDSYTPQQMLSRHPALEVQYSVLSGRTLQRDLAILHTVGLLASYGRRYRLNTNILKGELPPVPDELE